MGTASMYGNGCFDAELDCAWMTLFVEIHYCIHMEEEGKLIEIDHVMTKTGNNGAGYNVTEWLNEDYILSLIEEEISNADYHYLDHGDGP